jgi:hypothetical protein
MKAPHSDEEIAKLGTRPAGVGLSHPKDAKKKGHFRMEMKEQETTPAVRRMRMRDEKG